MKRKRITSKVKCSACHATTITNYRYNTNILYFCDSCEAIISYYEVTNNLIYFTSHIDDTVIVNSNYPNIIKINEYLVNHYRTIDISSIDVKNSVNYAAELIAKADCIVVIAGAGMSADSGVSIFRQQDNKSSRIALEDACYSSKPEKAWYSDAWYRRAIGSCQPHEGYRALLAMLEDRSSSFQHEESSFYLQC